MRDSLTKPPTAAALLAWYDRHRRELPWRVTPDMRAAGVLNDPYHVWLSEVMLQQTTVAAVKAYFQKFVTLWPRVEDLAAADTDDVMKAWAGLGYYARARNLKKCAEVVAKTHKGRFPESSHELCELPGIGDYTSAAIAAIAFDEAVPVMDGNVERVISRIFRIEDALPAGKPVYRSHLATLTPQTRPGDFAQAMMDLGATICTPKRPACALCPWRDGCRALHEGDPETYPVKAAKKAKPVRLGAAYVAVDEAGRVLLRKRPPEGLLGGMAEVPTTDWTSNRDGGTGVEHAPFVADWQACGTVTHVFTHFALRLSVYRADLDRTVDVVSVASPPSVLPDISPSGGEIGGGDRSATSAADYAARKISVRQGASLLPISPLEGASEAVAEGQKSMKSISADEGLSASSREGEPGRAEGGEAASSTPTAAPTWWTPIPDLAGEALPTVMKKAISAAIPTAFKTSR